MPRTHPQSSDGQFGFKLVCMRFMNSFFNQQQVSPWGCLCVYIYTTMLFCSA